MNASRVFIAIVRVPGKLIWDSKSMRFSNSEDANKYLQPYLRKGWELKL